VGRGGPQARPKIFIFNKYILYINIFIKYYGIYILACAIINRLPTTELVSQQIAFFLLFCGFLKCNDASSPIVISLPQ
jgi:hypothetical protein